MSLTMNELRGPAARGGPKLRFAPFVSFENPGSTDEITGTTLQTCCVALSLQIRQQHEEMTEAQEVPETLEMTKRREVTTT